MMEDLYFLHLLPLALLLICSSLLTILLVLVMSPSNTTKSFHRKIATITYDSTKTSLNADNSNERERNNGLESGRLGEHITWQEYFMSVAQLAAKRSKDPCTQVGACIVNEQNKIVATGYNGMPNGIQDTQVPWKKEGAFLDTKYAYVVHAELNAILNSILTDQTGCRLYVSLFPCNECAKAIIQTGIRHVIYLSDKHKDKDSTKAAKRMFKMAGVRYELFEGCLLIR